MNTAGIIALTALSLIAVLSLILRNGLGAGHYIIKPAVGMYVMVIGLLSLFRAPYSSLSLYLSIATIICAILMLLTQRNKRRIQIIGVLGVVLGSIATYLSYIT